MIEDEFLAPAEDLFPWLHANIAIPPTNIELIHSHKRAIWPILIKRLAEEVVGKITVVAPFYDQDLVFLYRLQEHWPNAALTIVAQPDYATLPGKKLGKLFGVRGHRLISARPPPGRRLHAKAFAFQTNNGTLWLSGSPNATLAAFDGDNTEAALWLRTKESADYFLKSGDLELKETDPVEFTSGIEEEPHNVKGHGDKLVLRSAVLAENGEIECELDTPETSKNLTLRVRNVNETLPMVSLPVRRTTRNKASVELNENQIAQSRQFYGGFPVHDAYALFRSSVTLPAASLPSTIAATCAPQASSAARFSVA